MSNRFLLMLGEFQYFSQLFQGLILDQTVPFFPKIVLIQGISW